MNCPVCGEKEIAYIEKSVDFFRGPINAIVAACSKDYTHDYKLENKLMRIGRITNIKQ